MRSGYKKNSFAVVRIGLVTVTVLCLLSLNSLADEMKIYQGVKGIWYQPYESEPEEFSWKAHWIWVDEALEKDVILARRSIQLGKIPEKAVLRITASSSYQLYINGEYICRGPARCAPHHQSYDILDISGILTKGENSISVRVHHQDGKKSYQYDGRAGLLVQLNLEEENSKTILISDATWKIIADPSWDNNAPLISRFQQVVNDRVDFRKELKGWNGTGFDDSLWSNAAELMRTIGWPETQKNAKPQTFTPPWTSLVPRDIPYLVEKDIKAEKLIEGALTETEIDKKPIALTGKIDNKIAHGEICKLPSSGLKTWFLLYDFGEVINGMPQLDIQGTTGTEVQIVTAPYIVSNQFSKITVDSEFLDKIILSGERDKWEATCLKPARYLGIVVKNVEPVIIYSAGIYQIKYPFDKRGDISSEDAPWIKNYFEASAKTINVCTTDAYTDNYRECRQYAQTDYYASLGNYFTFGDFALQRRYLVQVAQEQLANGIMPAYAPAHDDDYMIILESNCLWIRGLINYLLYSGDELTVRELLPNAQKLMELLHSYTNEQGLIDNPPFAYWLDHSLNDRRGANLTLNGHYLGALQDYAELLSWLKLEGTELFERRAEKLKCSIQLFWDDEKKLFSDAVINGKRSEMYSEHASAMALAMEAATPEQAKMVAEQLVANDKHNYIKRESGITMVTPAMSYFLHKGLCNYGYVDESFELFRRRFDKMLDPTTNQTLWEEWWLDGTGRTGTFQKGRTRSDAQTESAFPPALFAEYLLGVQPKKAGLKEVEIKRTLSTLKNIEGKIPSPEGILNIKWNLYKRGGNLELDIPGEMKVSLDLSSLNFFNGNMVSLDGNELDSKKIQEPFLLLPGGNHKIEF